MKAHLRPDIICILDEPPQKEHFLLFTLKNTGPIEATNVIVDHSTLRFSKKDRKIRFGSPAGGPVLDYNEPGERWIFKDRLIPNEKIYKLTGESALRDASKSIDVLVFDLTYYRDTDGERYNKRVVFYVEGKTIFSKQQFRSHSDYGVVVSEESRFLAKMPNFKYPISKAKQ